MKWSLKYECKLNASQTDKNGILTGLYIMGIMKLVLKEKEKPRKKSWDTRKWDE